MNVSIIIATYGEKSWSELAWKRAVPSAEQQPCFQVKVGHQPEQTIARVRNALAADCSTDWLCFLDADDELAPGYLEAMRRAYERAGDGPVLLTPAVQKVRKGRKHPHTDFYPEVDLRIANWLVIGTMLKRSLFERVGGFEDYPHGFEDFSLWSKCARVGARVVKVRDAIYIQHVNPQSKHRQGWRDRKWQVKTHNCVNKELGEWEHENAHLKVLV
jgi:glycosyltransferase involved in cell wall biosynthesis